jgi:multidrug efflux pump subunit AcrA (membrane-fusion protein)
MQCLSTLRIGPALVLGCCLGLPACTRAPSEAPAPAPTAVMVSSPVERDVTDYADFTARTAAVDSVGVRARVWGYLDKVTFTEGTLVKKGDVLFAIDPRTYQGRYTPQSAARSRQPFPRAAVRPC